MTKVFNNINVDLNYLSPYIRIEIIDTGILFYNPVFDTYSRIACENDIGKELLSMLERGTANAVLLDYLTNNVGLSEEDYYYLLKEGIII